MTSYVVDLLDLVGLMEGSKPLRHVVGPDNRVPVDRIVTTEGQIRELLQEHMCWSDIEHVIQHLKVEDTKCT